MRNSQFVIQKIILTICIVIAWTTFSKNSFALDGIVTDKKQGNYQKDYIPQTGERMRGASTFDDQGIATYPREFKFDPYFGKDFNFQFDNPVCLSFAATALTGVQVATRAGSKICTPLSISGSITIGSGITGALTTFLMAPVNMTVAGGGCAAAYFSGNYGCCYALGYITAAQAAVFAWLGTTFAIADAGLKNLHICGADWKIFKQKEPGDKVKYDFGPFEGSYQYTLINTLQKGKTYYDSVKDAKKLPSFEQMQRELIYGGKEYSDPGCKDPLLGKNGRQTRYFRGLDAPNFACDRYSVTSQLPYNELLKRYPVIQDEYPSTNNKSATRLRQDLLNAYICCKDRSQTTTCIEGAGNREYKICEAGALCSGIDGITVKVYESSQFRRLCAHTYSVCPYNHTIAGGMEVCVDENDDGYCDNFVQHLAHCSNIPSIKNNYVSFLGNKYVDQSCMNFIGSSQNIIYVNFNDVSQGMKNEIPNDNSLSDSLLGHAVYRNFSAPIVECVTETMKNTFMNEAGYTTCADKTDPVNGICGGDKPTDYVQKKGDKVKNQSIIEYIQSKIRDIVTIMLILVVTFAGLKTMFTPLDTDKLLNETKGKAITSFAIKVGFIYWFALGTGWQEYISTGLINGVQNIANLYTGDEYAKYSKNPELYDKDYDNGCNFPLLIDSSDKTTPNQWHYKKYKGKDGSPKEYGYIAKGTAGYPAYKPYPKGKEYLAIWDSWDCKASQFIGYSPGVNVPNLIPLALSTLLTTHGGGLGILFTIVSFSMITILFVTILRAMHIFIQSTILVYIMIYISPITISMAVVPKTAGIFNKWLKNIVSFALQPVILIIFIIFAFEIFDLVVVENTKFTGISPGKTASCPDVLLSNATDSVLCIFERNTKNLTINTTLAALGLGWPTLIANGLLQWFTMLKILQAVLVIFVIFTAVDHIPGLASTLTGGSKIGSSSPTAFEALSAVAGVASGVQKRVASFAKGQAGKLAKNIKGAVATAKEKRADAVQQQPNNPQPTQNPDRDFSKDDSGSDNGNSGNDSSQNKDEGDKSESNQKSDEEPKGQNENSAGNNNESNGNTGQNDDSNVGNDADENGGVNPTEKQNQNDESNVGEDGNENTKVNPTEK